MLPVGLNIHKIVDDVNRAGNQTQQNKGRSHPQQ
jgi:hypothetical protein